MKRKFSLLVTIVFCLLIVAGILSACNDPVEGLESVAGSYFMKDDSSGWWELGLDGQWLNSLGERGTYEFTPGEGDEVNGELAFYDATGAVVYTGNVQGAGLGIKGDTEVLWNLEKNPNTVNFEAVYAYAAELGFEGDLEELVKLFKGDSAYGLAKKYGYTGTEKDWLDSLRGEKGDSGKSAYDLVVELGYKGTLSDWLSSLMGDKGDKGDKGDQGDSAYDIACGFGFIGTIQDWLNSLGGNGIEKIEKTSSEGNVDTYTIYYTKGGTTTFTVTNGKSAYELAVENGYQGTLEEWLASLVGETGAQGADGKSAYELAVENGYEGTLDEWLESLVGAAGVPGATGEAGEDGKSAYELAVENGFEGSLEEWLTSLVGSSGEDGTDGADGEDGAPGADGVGIEKIEKTGSDGNVDTYTIYFTNGETTTFTVTNAPVEEIVTVTVTFDADGGIISGYTYIELNATEVSGVYTVELESGESIEQLPEPTKTGYRFTGWYTGDSVNDSRWFNNLSIVSDMTLYAGWTEIREDIYCVVSYDSAGGSAVPAEEVIYGGKATEPEAPVKPGYDFEGWYLGSEKWSFVGYSVTEDMTLTAKWTLSEKNYSLTLIAGEGGSVSGEGSFLYNETVTVVAAPEQGYSFDGWYDGERLVSGDAAYTFPMPANDYELTAAFIGTAIVAIEQVDLGEVEYGTAFADLDLPAQLTATDENGEDVTVSVTWGGDYDAEKIGPQTLVGDVTLPESYYYLADSVSAEAVLVILPEAVDPIAIVSIDDPAGIDVKFNTTFNALPLPEYALAETDGGDEISVRITWRSDDYVRGVLGEQTIGGVLYPEYGYYLAEGVSNEVEITLNVIANTITAFDSIDLGRIPVNIAFEDLWLPGTVGADAENGEKYHFTVTWNADDYNGAIEGTYRIAGAVVVPEGYAVADGLAATTYAEVTVSSLMKGIVDIAFVVDTTGSMMNEINNVRDNINTFAEQLDALGINVRWALIEYRDMTLASESEKTQVHMYFSENWYINVNAYKDEIGDLTASGGGDGPETIIDALETARRLDMREEASKFFIAVTDADYKVNNNFGISGMDEMIDLLLSDEVIVSVVTNTYYFDEYHDLAYDTGGILCDINEDFADELMNLIDLIDDTVENRLLDRIEITKQPAKTEYYSGDLFSSAGMEVTAYYVDGTAKTITTFDIEPARALQLSDTYVTVRYRKATAKVHITVSQPNYPVTGVEINKSTVSLEQGETTTLTASVAPANASNKGVLWSSDNLNVVTVSGGRLNAVGIGTATVTVTTLDGGFYDECTVTVVAPGVSDIQLDVTYIYGKPGDMFDIAYTVYPAGAAYDAEDVIWATSNAEVCVVAGGTVTLIGEGTANISLTINGKTAYCMVVSNCEHELFLVSEIAATCTEMGSKMYECTKCSYTHTVAIAATGHNYVVESVTVPTCTTAGETVYKCSHCGNSYTVTTYASHNYELVETVPATCTKAGYQLFRCSVCEDEYTIEIPAGGGHDYVGVVTKQPTTEEEGVMTYTCSVCSDSYTMPLAKLNEGSGKVLLVQDRLPWTTDNNAVILNYLTANQMIDGWEIVSSSGLSSAVLGEYNVIYIANDQTTATYNRLQQLSGALTEYVEGGGVLIYGACDHGWAAGDISYDLPGGVSIGNYYSNYNYIVNGSHDIVTGILTGGEAISDKMLYSTYSSHTTFHNLPEGSTVILQDAHGDPTLAEYPLGAGYVIASGLTWEYTYERTFVDGSSFAKEIFDDLFVYAMSLSSKCDHVYEQTAVVRPTCTADGYTEYACTECGRVYRSDYVEATGHTWDEGELTTAPGCTETGVRTYTCLVCRDTMTETVAATGHSFTNYVSDGNATCTSDGTETAICDNCDATDTRTDVGSATGHENKTSTDIKPPTCTEDGYVVMACGKCGYTERTVIKALGHNLTAIEAIDATCTEAGNNAYYHCSRCDKYFKDIEGEEETTVEAETIPATGHKWDDGEVTVAATCTEDGVMTYTCLDCGETKTETIAAAGHDYEETVIAPTCTEEGYILYECRNCDDSYTDNEAAALGHYMTLTEAKEATCTEAGNNAYYHCSRCDKYFKDIEGEEETTVDAETISATGHNYVNGECVNCGAIEPGYGDEDVYTRVDEDGNESATGEYILFGSYPQTKVTDASVISALGEFDESTWTSYGYFIERQVSDYMYYIDKEYNGEKYRGVYFTSYRPYYCLNPSSTSTSRQGNNGYATSTVYWFKYEPIKWLIAEESDGKATLVADLILDSQQYDYEANKEFGNNNYAESTIRAWLNESFYNTAFNELQQAIIQTVEVDNSAESMGYSSSSYACENTNDKIFLMSYVEATTWFTSDSAREKQGGSDYAKSQGLLVSTSFPYSGNSWYWLRSPSGDHSGSARVVYSGGDIGNSIVFDTSNGVLPALVIELGESVEHIHTMEIISATEATCTEEGNNEYYYCSECNKYFKDIEGEEETTVEAEAIPAGHIWNDGKVTTEATCTTDGEKIYTCLSCGESKTGIIPATGHNWNGGEITTAATCTMVGERIYTCLSCGESKTGIIPATGHNYVNGECVNCGAIEPGYGDEDVYTRVDEDGNESATGDYILFGSYPQTKVTDASIISALGGFDESTWTSYGYFIEGQVSDYMYYIDKEYNGEKYRGVYFTSYRPDYCSYSSSASDSHQDDNGYVTSTVYWFKYEPIKWLIVEESEGKATLVADLILDSQQYDYEANKETYGSNNYAESTIRAWLNESFYNTAFNELQQAIIQTVEVDNSVESTGYNPNQYACENTFDKTFLMSYVEATTWFTRNSAREKQGSDYAKSQGLWVSTRSSYSGNSAYWLRSPYIGSSGSARVVGDGGSVGYSYVFRTDLGVLPALVISLGEPAEHIHTMETTSATEATCTEEGNKEYYYCSECNKYFKDIEGEEETTVEAETIPAGHVIVDGVCTVCGELIYTEGLEYTLSFDETYYIVTGIGTASGDIIIPDTHEGLPVKEIGSSAFSGCSSLTSIEIPAGVTSIGSSAFSGCSNLESVTFAEGSQLPSIGYQAFYECSSLTSIEIPAGVTSIGSSAFSGCSNLESVTFAEGSGLTSIGVGAFYGCSSLTSIEIPAGVTSIGSSAFEDCSNLESVTFAEGSQLTSIESTAFIGCSSLTSISIPAGVTSIGRSAFEGCSNLASLTFAEGSGLTSIGEEAFRYCRSLTSIEIPAGVTSIGSHAFYRCSNLESVAFAEGSQLTSIGDYVFHDCSSLTSIEIPVGVTSIGNSAFYGCYLTIVYNYSDLDIMAGSSDYGYVAYYAEVVLTEENQDNVNTDDNGYVTYTDGEEVLLLGYLGSEKDIVIPEGVTRIAKYAFYWDDIVSVTLPESLTEIGDSAFEHCYTLKEVYNNSSLNITAGSTDHGHVAEYAAIVHASDESESIFDDESGFAIVDGVLYGYRGSATNIIIPETVTSIAEYAFYGNNDIISVSIPAGVTSIGNDAFEDCSNLASVTFAEGSQLTRIGGYAFRDCSSLKSIDIPAGVTELPDGGWNGSRYVGVFSGCSNLESVTFAEGSQLTSIGDGAFSRCSSLTSIDIPAGVTSIGSSAFENCSNLTSIDIPAGVTSIENAAFYGCSSLTSIEIPAGVTRIGSSAFGNCSSLQSIEIPAGVTRIVEYTFSYCTNLESVTFAEGSQLTSIGWDAFSGCSSLTSIEIPAGVTSIGARAFSGCSSLTSIEIPAGVSELPDGSYWSGVFSGCSNLESVTFAEGSQLTSIGDWAFSGCSSLTSIEIPEGVTSIGRYAFEDCSSLKSIEIPAWVTSIGSSAFSGCSNLTSIEIPAGVTSIGSSAFLECNLETIYYNGTEEQWNAIEKGVNWNLNCGNYEVVFLEDAGTEGGEG